MLHENNSGDQRKPSKKVLRPAPLAVIKFAINEKMQARQKYFLNRKKCNRFAQYRSMNVLDTFSEKTNKTTKSKFIYLYGDYIGINHNNIKSFSLHGTTCDYIYF